MQCSSQCSVSPGEAATRPETWHQKVLGAEIQWVFPLPLVSQDKVCVWVHARVPPPFPRVYARTSCIMCVSEKDRARTACVWVRTVFIRVCVCAQYTCPTQLFVFYSHIIPLFTFNLSVESTHAISTWVHIFEYRCEFWNTLRYTVPSCHVI